MEYEEFLKLLKSRLRPDFYYSSSQEEKMKKNSSTEKNDKDLKSVRISTKREHPKIALLVTSGLVAFVTFLIVAGILSYLGELTTKEFFIFPISASKEYTLTKYEFVGDNPPTTEQYKQKMIIQVKLLTSSLSVQNPIKVEADFIFENVPNEAWESFPDVHILVFPDALNYPVEILSDGFPNSAAIKMNKMDHVKIYRGYGEIVYPLPSDGGFLILTPEDVTKVSKTNIGEDIVELSMLMGDLSQKVEPVSRFHVEKQDLTERAEQTDIILFLTFTIVGIGVIQIREQIIDGFIWFYKRCAK